MLVPALIYVIFNLHNPQKLHGWAIPTATDVAFALGVLSLLGSRVPLSLKVFLTALAIFDDVGAIIIIAIFYAEHISLAYLGLALACWLGLIALNFFKIKKISFYLGGGILLWLLMLKSGIHAALAGVALGSVVPLTTTQHDDHSPLRQIEQRLHPWVAFGILPLFGLANAGISFAGMSSQLLFNPLNLGIALGLFLGKQCGVFAAIKLAVKTKLAKMPEDINYLQMYGVAVICGIGFTMSLFIGALAFPATNPLDETLVRFGVLSGSLLSGVLGYLLLRLTVRQHNKII